ncbi:MAG: hypothetical protein DCC67_17835 [Planctomycetota bacterium]|nr:MAG: hypothetical protein DCC67_17835 [Planctomycetota bacterium]
MSIATHWNRRTPMLLVFTAVAAAWLPAPHAAAQTGSFLAVLSDTTNNSNGDSQASVLFFDAQNPGGGPMFAVFKGFEGASNTDYTDGLGITVNPANGDVYFTEFDSGTANEGDTSLDMDLYRIDFAEVYNHWAANFQGKNARDAGAAVHVDLASPAPSNGVAANPPGSIKNSTNQSYVTYSVGPTNGGAFGFGIAHSNQFTLPGVITKVGEIKRNNSTNPSPFFPGTLEFIDENTLIEIDDSVGPDTAESPATDHQYRIIERVSTSPGQANGATVDHGDGGYNVGASESWNSRAIGVVNLDFGTDGLPAGHSEPESLSYYASGNVRGFWVAESDSGGDTIAFAQLDASNNFAGYRPLSTSGNPTSFALDDNPAASTTTNDGRSDNLFVDQDTGDLIIVESGFGDATPTEPGVLRLHINSYDNGAGQIDVGSWDAKVLLNPAKTTGVAATNLVRGYWSAYDSASDKVYFINPGSGGASNPNETPQFGNDVWVLDLATGTTSSFLDVDDSISLFTSDAFGDKVVAFTLGAAPADNADFDGSGLVDGNDFLIWQRNFGVGTTLSAGDANASGSVDAADLAIWKAQYGTAPVAAAAAAVPEPAGLALVGCGAALGGFIRRRR